MTATIVVVIATLLAGFFLFRPQLRRNEDWQAMVTPLASIIGSGFLLLGPILNVKFGGYAPLIMAALCTVAYGYGAAVRRNIVMLEKGAHADPHRYKLERIGGWALAFSYIVSTPYYLNLMGAFAVTLTPFHDPVYGRVVATAAFLIILVVGWTKGFGGLEPMEQYAVSIKLAIIVGLLSGLAVYFFHQAQASQLSFGQPTISGWNAVAICFGLVVTVQGFETSRYLGDTYSARTRVFSMTWAQLLSAAIYMVYTVLLVYAIPPTGEPLTDTSVVGMMQRVSVILPLLLVISAFVAQFGAAVADTAGAGGLLEEETGGRISPNAAYAILAAVGILLTWTANVFELVSYASRAFAFYYGIEALTAARSLQKSDPKRAFVFYALAVLAVLIVVFGRAVE